MLEERKSLLKLIARYILQTHTKEKECTKVISISTQGAQQSNSEKMDSATSIRNTA